MTADAFGENPSISAPKAPGPKRAQLDRFDATAFAAYGILIDAYTRKEICVTLELPWENNAADVSCIPAGVYQVAMRPSKRGYLVPGLLNVPGRSDIEIHKGNVSGDTKGCILVGRRREVINGQRGIAGSNEAFERLLNWLDGAESFEIVIHDPSPEPLT